MLSIPCSISDSLYDHPTRLVAFALNDTTEKRDPFMPRGANFFTSLWEKFFEWSNALSESPFCIEPLSSSNRAKSILMAQEDGSDGEVHDASTEGGGGEGGGGEGGRLDGGGFGGGGLGGDGVESGDVGGSASHKSQVFLHCFLCFFLLHLFSLHLKFFALSTHGGALGGWGGRLSPLAARITGSHCGGHATG